MSAYDFGFCYSRTALLKKNAKAVEDALHIGSAPAPVSTVEKFVAFMRVLDQPTNIPRLWL